MGRDGTIAERDLYRRSDRVVATGYRVIGEERVEVVQVGQFCELSGAAGGLPSSCAASWFSVGRRTE